MRRLLYAAIFVLVGTVQPAQAARFENGYLAFELPQGWTCHREDMEFVCEPPHAADHPVHTVMILAAKISGPDDTLAAYRRRLEQQPPATGKGSIAVPARTVTINDTIWVDATLDGSELPNYLTRYLATSKEGISVLFTFSAHRDYYDALVGSALRAIYTLQLKRQ